MAKKNARDTILDAAQEIVVEHGALRMTLDAVAKRAEISKGGLLYHFPHKNALLRAMLDRLLDRALKRRRDAMERLDPGGPRTLLAELAAKHLRPSAERHVGAALLAAVANEPSLLEGVRKYHRDLMHQIQEEDGDFEWTSILLLAMQGLHMMELHQVSPYSASMRESILNRIKSEAISLNRGHTARATRKRSPN